MNARIIDLPLLSPSADMVDTAIEISKDGSPRTSYRSPAAIVGVASKVWVLSLSDTAPPGSPAEGDRYIVAPAATGAWAGQDNNIAEWLLDGEGNGAWYFSSKPVFVYVEDQGAVFRKVAGVWVGVAATAATQTGAFNLTNASKLWPVHLSAPIIVTLPGTITADFEVVLVDVDGIASGTNNLSANTAISGETVLINQPNGFCRIYFSAKLDKGMIVG